MNYPVNPEDFAISSVNGLSLDLDVDAHINKTMEVYQAAYAKAVESNKEHGFDNESNSEPVEVDHDSFRRMVKKGKI